MNVEIKQVLHISFIIFELITRYMKLYLTFINKIISKYLEIHSAAFTFQMSLVIE